MRAPRGWMTLAAALAMACGGGEDAAPPPGTPPADVPPPATEASAQDSAAGDTTGSQSTQLLREVFAYRGSGRDPFRSLLASGEVRPLFEDLRLAAVVYDARYPARSVAVLRDVSVNRRYDVRVDDELGRLRVVEIRPNEVIFTLEEFGVSRQVSLALRRTQEGIP
ncbi:MAG TPA: hypothetical protein VD793_00530 [Gemmatimonadales bacterium]|nr:hypothetical protein [Gemmatimonadales bacterium]